MDRKTRVLGLIARSAKAGGSESLTTVSVAEEAEVPQQTVSRIIRELEEEGLIERKGKGMSITVKGMEALRDDYGELREALEPGNLLIEGRVTAGLGEGKRFMGIPEYAKATKKAVGFSPYPGTLNITLDEENVKRRMELTRLEPAVVKGFEKGMRRFGGVFLYRCRVGNENGAVLIPLKTRHPINVLEVIAEGNLRKKLGLKDGDSVLLEVG
ncbi:MAG: DUF120 domain-containing protein [Candidatus Bilamarchaeaceae archaeon]